MALSIFPIALVQPYADFLITIKKHLFLFPILAVVSLSAFLLTWYAIHFNFGIAGVAVAVTIANVLNFALTFFFASRYLDRFQSAMIKFLLFISCKLYVVSVLFIINHWFSQIQITFLSTLIQLLIFSIFVSPFLFLLNRKFDLLALIRKKGPSKIISADPFGENIL
jgi:O-antigen/teichoic acid export membrane protein